jgi:hypothetical protein
MVFRHRRGETTRWFRLAIRRRQRLDDYHLGSNEVKPTGAPKGAEEPTSGRREGGPSLCRLFIHRGLQHANQRGLQPCPVDFQRHHQCVDLGSPESSGLIPPLVRRNPRAEVLGLPNIQRIPAVARGPREDIETANRLPFRRVGVVYRERKRLVRAYRPVTCGYLASPLSRQIMRRLRGLSIVRNVHGGSVLERGCT